MKKQLITLISLVIGTYAISSEPNLSHSSKEWQIWAYSSAAPDFLGTKELVDPEQAYVASLASCHALTFLAICSMQGIAVETYTDKAVGFLDKADDGKPWLARVELHPAATFNDQTALDESKLQQLHETAHHECFLARSVKTDIRVIHQIPAN